MVLNGLLECLIELDYAAIWSELGDVWKIAQDAKAFQ